MEDKNYPILPNSEQNNELNEKHVFINKNDAAETDDRFEDIAAGEKIPDMNEKVVLDEAFAARRPAAPAARRTPAQTPPPVRRDFSGDMMGLPKFKLPKFSWQSLRPSLKMRRVRKGEPQKRLYSGELPADALRRIAREFCALLIFCAVVGGGFWLKDFISDYVTDNAIDSIVKSTTYSNAVYCTRPQINEKDLPDGYAAAQAVCTLMGSPITDRSVFVKDTNDKFFASDAADCMETVLPSDQVVLESNMTNLDLLLGIYTSLSNDKPVIVMLADEIDGEYALTYGVVTHMDAENDIIVVIKPGNGAKQYSLENFIAATRFDTYEDMPLSTRIGVAFGTWSRNTAIFVEDITEAAE